MNDTVAILLKRLDELSQSISDVIPWSCPVPSFGDLAVSKVATLGLNPSNREFVDNLGVELDGESRRFHTLNSLRLSRWSDAEEHHLSLIAESCRAYFCRNPYDGWFKKLDYLISGTNCSYYDAWNRACHLDLIPYATQCKWTELKREQRDTLFEIAGDTLAILLRDSPVRLLVLNGNSVVEQFQAIANIEFDKRAMADWSLPRQCHSPVTGFAYQGVIREISGVELNREILILGFNHNIQSSFGVTKAVTAAIRGWITKSAMEVLS